MSYAQLLVCFPCQNLDDLSRQSDPAESDGLLAGWVAAWHPALIARSQQIPRWVPADQLPQDLSGALVVVPPVAEPLLPSDPWAEAEGCVAVRGKSDTQSILQQALGARANQYPGLDPETVADFFSLGYCYLQVELLTRRMRYASTLELSTFQQRVVECAQAAVAGALSPRPEGLQGCFDLLAQQRNHYYPVDVYLIDLAIVPAQDSAERIDWELARQRPVNLLLAGHILDQLAQSAPDTVAALKGAVEAGQIGVLGGEYDELPLPLVAGECCLRQLLSGLDVFQQHLNWRPRAFGRRRFGLHPALPQLLRKTGFDAALHATLDDGQFPEASQTKSRWEGIDGSSLPALARAPLDATKAHIFLGFAAQLSQAMDVDYVATRVLARWAGQIHPWFDLVHRTTNYARAMGKFVTVHQYFQESHDAGIHDRFEGKQYRSPYLKQAVVAGEADPVSQSIRYWKWERRRGALESLAAMLTLVDCEEGLACAREVQAALQNPIHRAQPPDEQAVSDLDSRLRHVAERLVGRIATQSADTTDGIVVVNPSGWPCRTPVTLPADRHPPVQKPVYAVHRGRGVTQALVDVPGWGWSVVGGSATGAKAQPGIASKWRLQNEFVDASIDEQTGGLRSLRDYRSRTNRMAQLLAMRLPGSSAPASTAEGREPYTKMQATELEIVESTSTKGQIASRGTLIGESGQVVARFEQRFCLPRGSRVLWLEIHIEPSELPAGDPWTSYYACRFAWNSEASELTRGLVDIRQPAGMARLEAPLFLELDDGDSRTAILTGGLPYHVRFGARMLDTLLIVPGETQRRFQLGIGLDVAQPFRAAYQLLDPAPLTIPGPAGREPASSWLMHLDAKNVIATACQAITMDKQTDDLAPRDETHSRHLAPRDDTSQAGIRLRLVETQGCDTRATLRIARPPRRVDKTNFLGEKISQCSVDEDKISVLLTRYEWCQLEIYFS